MVVVAVRQGTLGVDGRGCGPAENTGHEWSWLRSGREHWAWIVVVEVRQGNTGRGWSWLRSREEEKKKEEEEKEKSINIKSNNPHLAGGEIQLLR